MFQSLGNSGIHQKKKKNCSGPLNSDLAVQDHHVMWVRGQPCLHGLTYGTNLIQRWGVEVWPAKVMNLVDEMKTKIMWLEELFFTQRYENHKETFLPLDLVG